MFVRVKKIDSKKTSREYLQIVESFRNGKSVRQRVLFSLGRMDLLKNSGQIDGLIQSLARFSETLRVEKSTVQPKVSTFSEKIWGPSLVFNRLWKNQKLPAIIDKLINKNHIDFNFERALFAKVLHRICEIKEDLSIDRWLEKTESPGFESLSSRHFSHAAHFLTNIRNTFEKKIYDGDLEHGKVKQGPIFLYTFRLNPPKSQIHHGIKKKKMGALPNKESRTALIVVATDVDGWPLGWEIAFEHINKAEGFQNILEKINPCYMKRPIVVVADHGSLPDSVSVDLFGRRHAPIQYIIGYHAKSMAMMDVLAKQQHEEIKSNGECYRVFFIGNGRAEAKIPYSKHLHELLNTHYKYQTQRIDPELRRNYSHGAIPPHHGDEVHSFITMHHGIDPRAFLLTDMNMCGNNIVEVYQRLSQIQKLFSQPYPANSASRIKNNATIDINQFIINFLALRLKIDLLHQLKKENIEVAWEAVMRSLKQLKVLKMEIDGKPFHLRSDVEEMTHRILQAAGIHLPNRVSAP